tara:strand:+ start:322 stop:612 length:291 start_codon:yes stop_codon:yes gene_type:complete
MRNIFTKNNLFNNFKKYKLTFIYSFSAGVLIAAVPYIYQSIENYRNEKFIQKEIQLQMKLKEKKCKDDGTDYKKFLNLGFPNTAIEKLKICLKKND